MIKDVVLFLCVAQITYTRIAQTLLKVLMVCCQLQYLMRLPLKKTQPVVSKACRPIKLFLVQRLLGGFQLTRHVYIWLRRSVVVRSTLYVCVKLINFLMNKKTSHACGRQSCPLKPKYNMVWAILRMLKLSTSQHNIFSLKHVTRISTLLQASRDASSRLLPIHHNPGAL